MDTTEHVYLVLYGAPTGRTKRPVKHIAQERHGELVPRCNSHYRSSQDIEPRKVRPIKEDEEDLRVCQRCLKWRPWSW